MPSPAHFGVMVSLAYHTCNLSELAEDQGVSLPSMSSTIDTLEERGWVRRSRSTLDRRVVNIELTDAGLSQLLVLQQYAEKKLLDLLGPITDDERVALSTGLDVMCRMFDIADGSGPFEVHPELK